MLKRIAIYTAALLITLSFSLPSALAAPTKGEQVVASALKHRGVPYKWGGTTPSGFDCSGFLIYVYKEFGISLARDSASQYNTNGTSVAKADIKPGDLVFFKNTYKAGISHAGVYIGNNQFIHAASSGVTVSSINDPYYWGPKYAGAKRVLQDAPKPVAPAAVPEPVRLPTLPAGQYHDIPTDFWAYNEVTALSKAGIINGYDQSLFKPEDTVTRAEAAKMLSTALNLTPKVLSTYKDLPENHWSAEYVGAVTTAGIMNGKGDGTFAPNDLITRAEIATLITRAFELEINETNTDLVDIDGHWAKDYIVTVASNQIASGYSDQTYQPDTKAVRVDFTVSLYRALNQ